MRFIEGVSHLTIATPDIDGAASDYAHLLGSTGHRGVDVEDRRTHTFRAGSLSVLIRAPRAGERSGLSELGFRVAALQRARDGFARCGLPSVEQEGTAAFDADVTHGLPLVLVEDASPPSGTQGATVLDHVVIRTPAPDRAITLYGGRLGLDMRLDRTNQAWNARLIFFRCGDLIVEVAHSLTDDSGEAGDSARDTFGGLSWRSPSIHALHARLTEQGFDLSPLRRGRKPGSVVCTVRTRTADVPTILIGTA